MKDNSDNKSTSQKSVWGAKRMFGGLAGLKFTADKIAEFIPPCKRYVEPFAGLARVANHIMYAEEIILNDWSEYLKNELPKLFPNAIITNEQFDDCMLRWDSKNTVMLIDPVWRKTCYEVNPMTVCDRTPYEYYKRVLEILPNLKCHWIVCSNVDEHEIKKILSKTAKERNYYSIIVNSDNNPIFGKKARTLLVSNMPFKTLIDLLDGDNIFEFREEDFLGGSNNLEHECIEYDSDKPEIQDIDTIHLHRECKDCNQQSVLVYIRRTSDNDERQ